VPKWKLRGTWGYSWDPSVGCQVIILGPWEVKVCVRRTKSMPWLLCEQPKDWDGLAWSRRFLFLPWIAHRRLPTIFSQSCTCGKAGNPQQTMCLLSSHGWGWPVGKWAIVGPWSGSYTWFFLDCLSVVEGGVTWDHSHGYKNRPWYLHQQTT